jgi:hypothetical protein
VLVVEREHLQRALGQLGDGLVEVGAELGLGEERGGIERGGGDVVRIVIAQASDRGRARELHRELLVLLERDPERLGDLLLRGRTTELVLELGHGPRDLRHAVAPVAREHVRRAELVEHRAADAPLGVGLEAIVAARIVRVDRAQQALGAARDEVVDLHARGQPPRHAEGDATYERQALLDEAIALGRCARCARGLERRRRRRRQ